MNKIKKPIIIFTLFILSLITSSLIYDTWQVLDKRYSHCNKYLLEGTLYKGQPYCEQPPLVYTVTAPIEKFFGNLGIVIASLIFNAITMFFIYLSINKRNLTSLILISFIYAVLVYPILMADFAVLLASVFLIAGYYFLKKNNIYSASIFLTLSFLSKSTALVAAVLLVILWVILNKQYKNNWKFYPALILLFIVYLIFPDFIWYGFFAHSGEVAMGNINDLLIALKTLWKYSLIYFMMMAIILIFLKKDYLLSITLLVGLPMLFIMISITFNFSFSPYYYAIFFVLFLVLMINNYKTLRLGTLLLTLFMVFVVFIYGFNAYTNHNYNNLVERYTAIYAKIPKQNESILVSNDLAYLFEKYNINNYDVVAVAYSIDYSNMRRLEKWGIVNPTQFMREDTDNQEKKSYQEIKKLSSSEYSLILMGPILKNPTKYPYNYLFVYLISSKSRPKHEYYKVEMPAPNNICPVCGDGNILLFKYKKDYESMRYNIEKYYDENFNYFCKIDQYFTNYHINFVMFKKNIIKTNKTCESEAKYYIYKRMQLIK